MKIKRMRFMTRREWVKKYYVGHDGDWFIGSVDGCPCDYELQNSDFYAYCEEPKDHITCDECWSQPAIINGKYILVRKED